MNQEKFQVSTIQLTGLIAVAYLFSFLMRMIWVWQFQGNPTFYWNDQMMINTNDGYFFAAGVQQTLEGLHTFNPRVHGWLDYGVIFFTTLLVKFTPMSLETAILYMPAIISSIVVVPIILIARLYGQVLWGFLAALLGSIAWSYYNRTMIGYYDTDMFSAMAPMFILYFLMKSTLQLNLRIALYAAIAVAIYPFLYDQGRAIVYAMGIIYTAYMLYYHRENLRIYGAFILLFVALIPLPLPTPWGYLVKLLLLVGLYGFLKRESLKQKELMMGAGVLFVLFLIFGNVLGLIVGKAMNYLATGTKGEGLHFYSVVQTVREAGHISFSTFANRISGSQLGVVLSLIGYGVLVVRHRAFILALPLIGIGVFALLGGLRFTVYAVPIAAMSAIYLFLVIAEQFIQQTKVRIAFVVVATLGMLYPNITHIIGYKVPTVLNKAEVEDLVKLDSLSDEKDYTLAWWDYGYPIWFYSHTNTLIDGGKHHNDNFIISQIMQTTSPELAANLSRVAVEEYVDSNYSIVANSLFKNKEADQRDPNLLLAEIENGTYPLPPKSRDIFLYLPYRMMNIFPTVAVFGNLDLTTGQKKRPFAFYPTRAVSSKQGIVKLQNGIIFDTKKGQLTIGAQSEAVKYFIVTQNTQSGKVLLNTQRFHANGRYSVIFMKSYGMFVVMDTQTFNSTYVQMFILEKYDKHLFELVISSPYSKIYKLKR